MIFYSEKNFKGGFQRLRLCYAEHKKGSTTPASVVSLSCAQSLQSCPTLCNSMDCSPPGSSVHEILQARILEGVAIPSSRGSPNPGIEPGSPALQADSFPLSHCGSPVLHL